MISASTRAALPETELAYAPDMATAQPTPRLRWAILRPGTWPEKVLQQEFVAYGRDAFGGAVPQAEWRDVPTIEGESS